MSKISPQIDQELKHLKHSNTLVSMSDISSVVGTILKALPWDKLNKAYTNTRQKSDDASVQKAVDDLGFVDIRNYLLPSIERELAAIVEALHSATSNILSSVEDLETNTADNSSEQVKEAITHIYEACSFQDITGQRMSKIIQLLKKLEMRVEGLLGRSGDDAATERYAKMLINQKKNYRQNEFLVGPTSGPVAITQKEIDDLFS